MLLVADDLAESCERALLVGFDLAIALGETAVHPEMLDEDLYFALDFFLQFRMIHGL